MGLSKITISVNIRAPLDSVFRFIADGENAPSWHPSIIEAKRILGTKLGIGSTVRYKAKIGPLELIWTTKAVEFEWNKGFKDVLVSVDKGPLRSYTLMGSFIEDKDITRVTMTLEYELSWGLLGKLLDVLFVRRRIKKHFQEGLEKVKELLEGKRGKN